MVQLFQDKPYKKCTYTLHTNRSYTDCLESRQYGGRKEATILRRNNRIPTVEIVWHLFRVLSPKEIRAFRTLVFDYLREHGIVAVVSIELTRGENGKPNNTVHFHFLLDDPRSENELREVFNTACEHSGLVRGKDFRIDYKSLDNGDRYFEYFTKYDRYYTGGDGNEEIDNESLKRKGWNWKTVLLFRKGTGLQKFYQIGKWFHKSKKQIWEEYKQEMQEMYGTDPDKNGSIDEQELSDDICYDPDENDYDNIEQSCNDEVPTDYNVWTMWCEYPDDTWEEISARFEQYQAENSASSEEIIEKKEELEELDTIELPGRHEKCKETIDNSDQRRISNWNKCPLYSCFPQENIMDRRYEWSRYMYCVAFLQ